MEESRKTALSNQLVTVFWLERFFRNPETLMFFYERPQNASLGIRLFVCPSVCLSHSAALSKRCKTGLQIFHYGPPQEICFIVTKCCAFVWADSFRTRVSQRSTSLKKRYFAAIGSYNVKTAADRYRYAAYHITSTGDGLFRFINIDDLEPP